MKSISKSRRISRILLISVSCLVVAMIGCVLFVSQSTKSTQVGNVGTLFIADPVAERPIISSPKITEPIASVVQPNSDEAVATAVAQTAAAQAVTSGSQVTYPTLQITPSQRDRLFVVALSIVMIGGSLYTMTLLSVAPRPAAVTRRPFYKAFDV